MLLPYASTFINLASTAKTLLYEWLLEQGKSLGIHGGSAFFATAGYGRHGVIHEQRFFELPEVLPVLVEFIISPEEVDMMLTSFGAKRFIAFAR